MGQLVKNLPTNARNVRDAGLILRLGRSPGVANGNLPQYCCLEKFHGQRSLAGFSLWGHKELDTTEHIHTRRIKAKRMANHLPWSHSQWIKELRFEPTSVRASSYSAEPGCWGAEDMHAHVPIQTHMAYRSRMSSKPTLTYSFYILPVLPDYLC